MRAFGTSLDHGGIKVRSHLLREVSQFSRAGVDYIRLYRLIGLTSIEPEDTHA